MMKILVLMLSLAGLASCESSNRHSTVNLEVMDEVQQVLTDSGAVSGRSQDEDGGPPEDVLQSLVPGLSLNTSIEEEVEERFDFTVRQPLDAREFFGLLTDGTDYSVAVHPDVTGNISGLNLKNITIEEAMSQVSTMYGWGIERNGNIFTITPGGVQTRFFKVNYLNVSRSGSSSMSVSGGGGLGQSGGTGGLGNTGLTGGVGNTGLAGIGGLGTTGGIGNTNGLGGNTAGGGQTSGSSGGGANVSTTSDANFWDDLEETIESIISIDGDTNGGGDLLGGLGRGGGRDVKVSPQSGVVIVTAYPDELARVEEFLKMTQASVQRQVVLEAKILEVELKEEFQSGIDLSILGRVNSTNSLAAEFDFLDGSADQDTNINPQTLTYNSSDFNGVIRLLESQGNVQVISSPRLTTLNNQKAVFKVGDEQYYLTQSTSTSFGAGDQQTTNQNANLQPFFSGIALDVTPFISENGEIFLHIHPLLNQVKEDLKLVGGEQLPLANSVTRESDTLALARNGEVVVISGLMQTRASGSEAGIPGARDLPLVGRGFEQRSTEIVKTELVILLKAIVDEGDNMRQLIQDSNDNMEKLRKSIDPYFR